MNREILTQLDELLPPAVAWAQQQEARILQRGVALNGSEVALAEKLGVRNSARMRLLDVNEMPQPQHSILREAALQTSFLAPQAGCCAAHSRTCSSTSGATPGRSA